MRSMSVSFIMLIALAFIAAVPIIVGVYVYKDAKRRNMDAALWTVVAVLVPGLVGLIIYLIVRGNHSDVICPACEKESSNTYVRCPHCGNPLKACCKNCNAVIDPSWKLCPQCGTEIHEEDFAQVMIPKPRKDKGIRVLVIILIAFLACALLVGGIGLVRYSFVGPQSGSAVTHGFHLDATADYLMPEVRSWISSCDAQGESVYALQLSPEKILESGRLDETPEKERKSACLVYVYINNLGEDSGILGLDSYVFIRSKTMEVGFTNTLLDPEDDIFMEGYELTEIFSSNDEIKNVMVLINGEEVACALTELK